LCCLAAVVTLAPVLFLSAADVHNSITIIYVAIIFPVIACLALPLSHCCSLVIVILRLSTWNAAAAFTVCCRDVAGIAQPVASCAALLYQHWLIVACCLLCHLLLVSCRLSFYFLFLVDCHLLFIVCH